jgi:hypothetical protein
MGRQDRSWERADRQDDDADSPGPLAAGIAFWLALLVCVVISGFTLVGALVGIVVGIVVLLAISRLSARSNRAPDSDGPPPPLL